VAGSNLLGPDYSQTVIEGSDADAAKPVSEVLVTGPPDLAVTEPSLNAVRTRIVYVESPPGQIGADAGQGNLVIARADGTDPREVTTDAIDSDPVWSPNGDSIAFLHNGAVWVMSATGSEQRPIAGDLPTFCTSLSWAPDGTRLAVQCGGPSRIAVVEVGTPSYVWFTPGGVEQYQPSWSPNGADLVYGQTGPNALFIRSVLGGPARQLTTCRLPTCTQDGEPVWSPDGKEIAFARNDYGVQQVYIVVAEGGQPRSLTGGAQQHALPAW
jgi:TolB protein